MHELESQVMSRGEDAFGKNAGPPAPPAIVNYMPDRLTKQARTESQGRKLLRGLRVYFFGPTIFSLILLSSESVWLAGFAGVFAGVLSDADLERRSPYLDGLDEPWWNFARGVVAGNFGAAFYTVAGIFLGHQLVRAPGWAIGTDLSLAGIVGIVPASLSEPEWILAFSVPILLLADLFIYIFHRGSHLDPKSIRWRMHRIHHSIPHLSLALGSRAHPIETLLTYGLFGAAGGVLGFGLAASFSAGIVAAMIMSSHHINCDNDLGPLERIFVTTEAHRWHHNIDHRDSGNFSLLFSFWDRRLGTYHVPERFSGRTGLDENA